MVVVFTVLYVFFVFFLVLSFWRLFTSTFLMRKPTGQPTGAAGPRSFRTLRAPREEVSGSKGRPVVGESEGARRRDFGWILFFYFFGGGRGCKSQVSAIHHMFFLKLACLLELNRVECLER